MAVGVYTDNDLSDKLSSFDVLEVKVNASAKLIGSPIETGQVIFDNKVIEPKSITVIGVLQTLNPDAQKTALKIENMRQEKDLKLVSVSDGLMSYKNLLLESYTTSRTPDKVDLVYYTLVFKEALAIDTDYAEGNITSHDYSSTQNAGFQQGSES